MEDKSAQKGTAWLLRTSECHYETTSSAVMKAQILLVETRGILGESL